MRGVDAAPLATPCLSCDSLDGRRTGPSFCSVLSNLDQPSCNCYAPNYYVLQQGVTPSILSGGIVVRTGPTPPRLVAATFKLISEFTDPDDCGYTLLVWQLTDATVNNYQPGTALTTSPTDLSFFSPTFNYSAVSSNVNFPSTIRCAHCVHCVQLCIGRALPSWSADRSARSASQV